LLRDILHSDHVGGFWDETLFPAIKDLVRYGADALSGSDFLDDVIDAVVDSAAGTLGYMAPQFMPAIMAASGEMKEPIHNIADRAISAAQEWARNIGGDAVEIPKFVQHGESVLSND